MKNPIRLSIALAGAVLCASPNPAMAQSSPGDSQGGQAAAIEGTWIQTISTPQGVQLFTALVSFTAGGVIVATGTGDRLPPFGMPTAPVSPSHGSWSRTDNNTYIGTLCFFIFYPTGEAQYMVKINSTVHLTDYNNLEGIGVGFYCDTSGNHCGEQPGHIGAGPPVIITGTRLIAQGASN